MCSYNFIELREEKTMNIIKKLQEAKHIYIYGAGRDGKIAYKNLTFTMFGFNVEGYVVTDASTYLLQGRKSNIVSIDELKINEGTLIVLALPEKYHEEVKKTLKNKGDVEYIIWNRDFIKLLWRENKFYEFEDRRRQLDKVCFVLAGYKDFLWENIFDRLKKFVPKDVDVCILSSGKKVDRLSDIAKENNWSYLSTNINDITLIQNIAMSVFDEYSWIYKMDEDIFLTENCFEKMKDMYDYVEKNEPYDVGCIAPLIPVNAYGYIKILDKLGGLNIYEDRFERAIYGGHPKRMIENNYKVAEFMWGKGGYIPKLDELNEIFSKDFAYSVCGVRFSIGFILYNRMLWEELEGFSVSGTVDLGVDEEEFCAYCINSSRAIIVAENTIVGHFSFGSQTNGMKDLYAEENQLFALP